MTMTMTMTTEPSCAVCGKGGAGIQFPLLPSNKFRNFGDICHSCDIHELHLIGDWRGGDIPESIQSQLDAWLMNRKAEHVENETG